MKLERILDNLNSIEKNPLIKIIDNILNDNPKNIKEIDKILSDQSRDLKAMDNINIAKVFNLISEDFENYIKTELQNSTSQLSILTDILIRDGNCIMKQDWLSRLYENEIKELKKNIKTFSSELESDKSSFDELRIRDYQIYKACVNTAFINDDANNQERKITSDELSILISLAEQLDLSREEIRLINYSILPLKHLSIDEVINQLKALGIILYSKKTNTIYIADEMVRLTRQASGKVIADKYFRRVLRALKDSQVILIARKHNIDRKLSKDKKIKEIINEGISFKSILSIDIYKEGTNQTEKKKFINELWEKGLKLNSKITGVTLDDKIEALIQYFEQLEKDDKVGIAIEGYERLLGDIAEILPKVNKLIKQEFELQEEDVLKSEYLLDYNIKPRDILELIEPADLEKFGQKKEIKKRGELIQNILESYKDADNLFLESFDLIGYRDLKGLKENGIVVKEADLGIIFEDLTKSIFTQLGLNVDEALKKSLNTNKDKIDVLINVGDNNLILVECKTNKESGFNKFSSVSRQLKSYMKLVEKNNYKVIKSLLIAPEFSDDFIKECGLDYELNLSLIGANSLKRILDGFKQSKLKVFPYNLIMRDVLIQEDRVIKAIGK